MTERTNGPWVIGPKIHGFDFSVVNPKGDAELGNWLVAGVRWEGNAKMVAAAPALLDAAKFAFAAMNSEEGRERAKAALVAAIAEATS